MGKFRPTIGLEIHAELNTKTKMFCSCKNDPDEARPNVNICPVCLGQPGSLPVINKQAVKNILKIGIAVGGKLADKTEFDRKNYFYPDIPKGYQISQYKHPLVAGGSLAGVDITRVHLEEDTATSQHVGDFSLVDFNRAGVPLMEMVTEPVMHSAEEVVHFGRELQLLLQYLGVAEANMEKGEMRLEANISVSADDTLGTKTEIKNLNSFRSAERAIEFEIKRQSEALEKGEKLVQETRGWDDVKGITYSQRSKEDSHDYRYFPDPDLPKLVLSEAPEMSRENLEKDLPETPEAKRTRLLSQYGIKSEHVEYFIFNPKLAELFEKSKINLFKIGGSNIQLLSNYLVNDIAGSMREVPQFNPSSEDISEIILMLEKGEISSLGAKEIIARLVIGNNDSPRKIAEEHSLFQKSDKGELEAMAKKVLENNPKVVEEYKSGKTSVLQFLVGQGMKESKGSANPALIRDILVELLSAQ